MCFTINTSLFIIYGLYHFIAYAVKKYISIWLRFIAVICIGVGVLTTIACNRYAIHTIGEKVDQIQTDKGEALLANSDPFQVGEKGMIAIYNKACEAIKVHDFNKLRSSLKEIEHPTKETFDDVLYLITGYNVDKKCKEEYAQGALLAQVITAHEGELSEAYSYTKESLDLLFQIIKNYGFGLKEAFSQKHGDDKNTLIHLGVNTVDLEIVECLIGWLKKALSQDRSYDSEERADGVKLIEICSMPNRLGITPLSMVAQAMYDAPFPCDGHIYDSESETHDYECLCDYKTEKRVAREEILLSLLELGIPWLENRGAKIESIIHYFIRYGAGNFLIKMMKAMQERAINKHTPEDLVSLKDKQCNSLLFYAVLCRDYKLAEYLRKLGACPMQANQQGLSPTLLAVAFRDVEMVECLLEAKCIQKQICNINKQHSNGLTALDVAESCDGCGLHPYLKAYCNKFKEKFRRQIVHNEWDWRPHWKISKRVRTTNDSYFNEYKKEAKLAACAIPCKKRKATDFDEGCRSKSSINCNKRIRSSSDLWFSVMQLSSTPSPFGGG